ncbi:hypothetical protein [Lentilitoribacter sp. Alg239-R112]|uniref:hypothetical protein n=1 Tax=Lentilitoribacter sp. Alg239-R112 TaxID=2305987 RepID=UPI0013A69E29|nr:hypothetical protein [Lentilitoribacter sp. Alg239-R112]
MIAKILSWLAGGGIAAIGQQLNDAYSAKLNAQNNEVRIEADKRIAYLHAQQAVLIAEQGSWMTRWIRPAFAAPFVIYNGKIILWDKALGLGVTDALSSEFWQLQMIIFGAYFLTRPFEKRARFASGQYNGN